MLVLLPLLPPAAIGIVLLVHHVLIAHPADEQGVH
jgi:hypothetical protein